MSDEERAEERKKMGNDYFAKGKLEAAIEAYSEAICFAPSNAVYYTNRAMCHRKKEHWQAVVSDCDTALRLDDTSIKGHYLLGVALDAQGDFAEASSQLWRALELCKERTISYKEDIQRAMLSARKRQWQAGAASSDLQVGTSEHVLPRLIQKHYDAERARLSAMGAYDTGESQRTIELQNERVMVAAAASDAFDALRRERGPGKVPDYYCCKITMEVMLDPVSTPDGITYERSVLLEHLQKVGHFDPVTRRTLTPAQLYPNLGLKEAITAYLAANPWAYESPT